MAGQLSANAEQILLQWMLGGGTAPTRPGTLYLALYTTTVDNAGNGTEVAGNGYARQAVTFGAPSAVSGTTAYQVANTNAPTFTASGGAWGSITYLAVFDAATGGNELFYASLTTARTVNNGDTISFPVGQVTLSLD